MPKPAPKPGRKPTAGSAPEPATGSDPKPAPASATGSAAPAGRAEQTGSGTPAKRAKPVGEQRRSTARTVTSSEPVVAGRGDAPAHHVRAALDKRLRVLVSREAGVRAGTDPSDLHKMRVSVRRMRAVLRAARPLLDAQWSDALRAELGWLGDALGPVRDSDVMLERLRAQIASLPEADRAAGGALVAELEHRRRVANAELVAALDTARWPALVDRVADAVRLPLPTPSATTSQPTIDELVRAEAHRLDRAVARAGEDPPDQVLHDLRLDGKRVRYVGELALPALRGTPAGRAVKRLLGATTGFQDVLGAHQDACVAEERLRALVAELPQLDPAAVFVAGRLVERERTRADAERAGWWTAWQRVEQEIRAL